MDFFSAGSDISSRRLAAIGRLSAYSPDIHSPLRFYNHSTPFFLTKNFFIRIHEKFYMENHEQIDRLIYVQANKQSYEQANEPA